MARAVVTGGAGFIGGALVHALRLRGDDVVALDTRRGPGIEIADVSRPGAWERALDGADLLIHAAAAGTGGFADPGPVAGPAVTGRDCVHAVDRDALWRTNAGGTSVVLAAGERAAVGRIVVMSSVAVLGVRFPDPVSEDAPVRPTGDVAADTLAALEHRALAAAARGLPVTVVRAGDCYGPRAGRWTLRPVALIRAGRFALVDGGRGLLTPVHIDDLTDAVLAIAAAKEAVGETLHVTGGEAVSAARFFTAYATMMDLPALPSVPLAVARGLAGLAGLTTSGSGSGEPARRSRGIAALPARLVSRADPRVRYDTGPVPIGALTRTGTYSIAKVRRVVGWRPRVDLDTGMARTEPWLRERGLLGVVEPARRG